MKINGDLSEARIRNEQLEELRRAIETEQREKNEMQRQVCFIHSPYRTRATVIRAILVLIS